MTKKTMSFLLLILLTAVAAGASPGDSTNGHGTFTTGGSAVTDFVFDAKETGSGAITGKARFASVGIDIEVNCLIILGDIAIIGGTDAANRRPRMPSRSPTMAGAQRPTRSLCRKSIRPARRSTLWGTSP